MMISITAMKNKYLKTLIAIVFWIGLWTVISFLIGKELILPSPFKVLRRLIELVITKDVWIKCLASLLRIMTGFISGTFVAVMLAIMKKKWFVSDAIITPFIRIIRSTPVTSFIILIMLWTGISNVPVVISGLMVMPVIFQNVVKGIEETDSKLVEVGKLFRFTKKKMLRYIYIPSVKPYFLSAALTALGLAWKSGIAAEVIALPLKAIGSEMYYSKLYLETADLFAWTAVVILLSYLLEKLFEYLIERGGKDENN